MFFILSFDNLYDPEPTSKEKNLNLLQWLSRVNLTAVLSSYDGYFFGVNPMMASWITGTTYKFIMGPMQLFFSVRFFRSFIFSLQLFLFHHVYAMKLLKVRNLSGEWISAPPVPETFVCNIGDMLKVSFTKSLHQINTSLELVEHLIKCGRNCRYIPMVCTSQLCIGR